MDAGVLHLLQTSLSKSSREQVTGAALLSLTTTPDNQKLKKHIALLCDRILKGYRPSGPRLEVGGARGGATERDSVMRIALLPALSRVIQ